MALRDNHTLMWYRGCIVALVGVVTHCVPRRIGRASGNHLATFLLVGVLRGDGNAVFLAVALLVGVLGTAVFPR